MNSNQARAQAEAAFKKPNSTHNEREPDGDVVQEKTAHLRALRLAKEATQGQSCRSRPYRRSKNKRIAEAPNRPLASKLTWPR
jgi:hypothetical protein